MDEMTLEQWIEYGVQRGFCTEQYCDTHAGTPLSDTENELFDEGSDPCIHVVRLGTEADWEANAVAYRAIV
jgi:hypothetical protein